MSSRSSRVERLDGETELARAPPRSRCDVATQRMSSSRAASAASRKRDRRAGAEPDAHPVLDQLRGGLGGELLLVRRCPSLARYCTAVTWADWVRGPEVEPSIYAADFARLGAQLEALLAAGARIFHFDVGDGHFIREITIGPVVLASISELVHERGGRLDCHLMVAEPGAALREHQGRGRRQRHLPRRGRRRSGAARSRGRASSGSAPASRSTRRPPVAQAAAAAEGADLALCMSIHPGLSGQKFMPEALEPDRGAPPLGAGHRPRTGRRRRQRGQRRARCATRAPTCSSPAARSSGRTTLPPPTAALAAAVADASRRRPLMARSGYERPPNHVIVLYGATGDLAKRKIIPGLFHLSIGRADAASATGSSASRAARCRTTRCARRRCSRSQMFGPKRTRAVGPAQLPPPHRRREPRGRRPRSSRAPSTRSAAGRAASSTSPSRPRRSRRVVEQLARQRARRSAGAVIIEKPFGTDLASARELNRVVHSAFDESDVFRIDHFLGKESVENILALRFANGMFEPVWNRDHIDHVQIDVPETLSIEGRAGVLRGHGRLPGHGRHAPVPGARLRRDGAADLARRRRRCASRRTRSSRR